MRKLLTGAFAATMVGIFFSASVFAASLSQGQNLPLAQADMEHQGKDMHAEHQHMLMKAVYADYFSIRSALAHDSMENVSKNAKDISGKIESYLKMHSAAAEVNSPLQDIQTSASKLSEKNDIAAARTEFGALSEKLVDYQTKFVVDKSEKAHVFFCDMVKEPWLQQEQEVGNPYFGSSMLKCGREIK